MMHVTIGQGGDEDADSDTIDSEYARKAAAFAAARKRKASFHYKGWYNYLSCDKWISMTWLRFHNYLKLFSAKRTLLYDTVIKSAL